MITHRIWCLPRVWIISGLTVLRFSKFCETCDFGDHCTWSSAIFFAQCAPIRLHNHMISGAIWLVGQTIGSETSWKNTALPTPGIISVSNILPEGVSTQSLSINLNSCKTVKFWVTYYSHVFRIFACKWKLPTPTRKRLFWNKTCKNLCTCPLSFCFLSLFTSFASISSSLPLFSSLSSRPPLLLYLLQFSPVFLPLLHVLFLLFHFSSSFSLPISIFLHLIAPLTPEFSLFSFPPDLPGGQQQ